MNTEEMFAISGLSPRVRGNRSPRAAGNIRRRSIPACAGEPIRAESPSDIMKVYPRVCGGTVYSVAQGRDVLGLSPRVRGNRDFVHRLLPPQRSIPACAGEPLPGEHQTEVLGVYPRVCGGTPSVVVFVMCVVGLSPRVRGNLDRLPGEGRAFRSIPACAGEPTARGRF